MNISNNMARLFQKIDTNQNGVSLDELNQVAGGDHSLSQEEASGLGITDKQDIDTINQALEHAKQSKMDPSEIVFSRAKFASPTNPPPGFAGNEQNSVETSALTQGAFAADTPDVATRMTRLNFALMSQRSQAMNGSFNIVQRNSSQTEVDLSSLNGVQNFDQIRERTLASIGSKESDAAGYLKSNYNSVAAGLGDDLNARYNGHVKFTGDADGMTAFQTPGADDIVVCTDIHASITAWHKANGTEAYTVSTSGNDAAHVFTIFKDPNSQKWNIQNYGTVVETDAKDIRDLYDRYMPEQRNIRFYSVDEKGTLHQERKVKTAVGMREWDFRNNLGAGNYDPSSAQQGVDLGTRGVSATFGGFNINYNPQNGTMGLNYHQRSQNGNTQVIQGVGAEVQNNTVNGYTTRRADIKYERRSSEFVEHNPNHLEQTTHHVSAYAGVEEASGSPIYWRDTNDGSTPVGNNDIGVRFGAQYNFLDRHYNRFGQSNLFLLSGYQGGIGATGTLSASSSGADIYETYAGRMLNDLSAEFRAPLGMAYITPTTFVQAGVLTGVNAANFDGVKDAGEQVGNMLEASAFMDARWKPSPYVSLVGMGNVDLKHSTGGEFVGQFAAGAEIALTTKLNWSTMAMVDVDTQLGSRGGIMTGLHFKPNQYFSAGVDGGVAMGGIPMLNGGIRLNY